MLNFSDILSPFLYHCLLFFVTAPSKAIFHKWLRDVWFFVLFFILNESWIMNHLAIECRAKKFCRKKFNRNLTKYDKHSNILSDASKFDLAHI